MNKFIKSAANVLEVENLTLDTTFREVENWCSLMGFGLLVMMENDWLAPISIDRFLELTTLRDLEREAFASFFSRVLKIDREKVFTARRGEIPQWDSINHLCLVMEAEQFFGVSYKLEEIPALEKLEDFLR